MSAPVEVFIVTEERNVNDRPLEGPEAWVLGVYADESSALEAADAAAVAARAEGKLVVTSGPEAEDGLADPKAEDADDWDVSFEVKRWPVIGGGA